jgi:hypothetical protein
VEQNKTQFGAEFQVNLSLITGAGGASGLAPYASSKYTVIGRMRAAS